jgi:hypothetical protein
MKKLLYGLSALLLLLTIGPAILNAAGKMDAGLMKSIMLAATILWFIVWPAALRANH